MMNLKEFTAWANQAVEANALVGSIKDNYTMGINAKNDQFVLNLMYAQTVNMAFIGQLIKSACEDINAIAIETKESKVSFEELLKDLKREP